MPLNDLFLWSSLDAFVRDALIESSDRAESIPAGLRRLRDRPGRIPQKLRFFDEVVDSVFGRAAVSIIYIPTAVLHKCGGRESQARYGAGWERDDAIANKIPVTIDLLSALFRRNGEDAAVHPVHLYGGGDEFCAECGGSCSGVEELKDSFDTAVRAYASSAGYPTRGVPELVAIPADNGAGAALDRLARSSGANMVMVHGGEVHWLMRTFRKAGFGAWIKSRPGIAYGGFSAGAIAAGASTAVSAMKHLADTGLFTSNVDEVGSAGCDIGGGKAESVLGCSTAGLGLYRGFVIPHVTKAHKDGFWDPLVLGALREKLGTENADTPMLLVNDDQLVHIGRDRIDTITSDQPKGGRYPRSYLAPGPYRMRFWWLAASFPIGSAARMIWDSRAVAMAANAAVVVCVLILLYDTGRTASLNASSRKITTGISSRGPASPGVPPRWPLAISLLTLGVLVEASRALLRPPAGA